MSNKYKFLILIITLGFLLLPFKSMASPLPDIMPNCDITVYKIQEDSKKYHDFDDHPECNGDCIDARNYVQLEKDGQSPEDKYGKVLKIIDYNPCDFDDFVALMVNAFKFGLAMLGAVVLFFFIWGGFGFIIAGGRTEKIDEAKKTIKGAFIGMLIVLTAWIMVNFYIIAFTDKEGNKIFGQFWYGGTEECHEKFNDVCKLNNLRHGCGGKLGSITDTYVRRLQQRLNALEGCDCGPVDGCFGQQTLECVKNFQWSNNLSEGVSPGVVGEITWQKINSGDGKCVDPETLEKIDNTNLPESNTCCIPTDETQNCYDSVYGNCDSGYTATEGTCDSNKNIDTCTFHICVISTNACYYQRETCNAINHFTNRTASSKNEAIEIISNMPECNMGTCAVDNYEVDCSLGRCYDCTWVSREECENKGGEFFYNIPIPNNDPDGDGYADLIIEGTLTVECKIN